MSLKSCTHLEDDLIRATVSRYSVIARSWVTADAWQLLVHLVLDVML
jgi:hypothetical protein